jgi:SAP domain.
MGKGPIKEARTATVTAKVAEPAPPPTTDLSTLTKADLVALAEQKAIDASGTKADIIERLSDG